MKIDRLMLKAVPYVISILIGLVIYFIGLNLSENWKSLFINLSAAFLAIPLIFLFYQVAQNLSKRRLNKEIFEYAKIQIDYEVLNITEQFYKLLYPPKDVGITTSEVQRFLSLKKEQIVVIFKENEYLGFQIFKNWEVAETHMHEMLSNNYILSRLNDDQIISTISIIKALRNIEVIQKVDDLYIETGEKNKSYKIVSGKELNENNIKYPDRYVLLQDLGDNKHRVMGFGDFSLYNINKLLHYYRVNEGYIEDYAQVVFEMINGINGWVNITGRELIIDNKMFRFKYHDPSKKVRII